MPQTDVTAPRTWNVDASHPRAADDNDGSAGAPLRTIQAAATRAEPGDTVVIHAGVYRERVAPARGGVADRPITYAAAPGARVCVRGSEEFRPAWTPLEGSPQVLRGSLEQVPFGSRAYDGRNDPELFGDFNPYHLHFNRNRVARPHARAVEEAREAVRAAEQRVATLDGGADSENGFLTDARRRLDAQRMELEELSRESRRRYRRTLGQLFLDGVPMREVTTMEDLARMPASWMADPDGAAILFHPPAHARRPEEGLVELSVRHTVFAPLERGLGYITVRGLVIEHAANHFPCWGKSGWAQSGALSCRSGHHWVIEDCLIRHNKSLGIDCGREGTAERMENPQSGPGKAGLRGADDAGRVGYHLIRRNVVSDNGLCGIAGIGHTGTRVLGNVIERNNADGWTSPWWEFGGIKFHFFYDGLIEGNLIRDNDTHGIWIDNQWRGSRITRNVIVGNTWSGINVELGRGPVMIDHNIIAHTRQGDGIYGHDLADVTIAHNLIYANANFGLWFAFATPRVRAADGCWDIKAFNNLILGNRAGAIGYPLPWEAAGNNVSDGNLIMGGGQSLDEGAGPQPPLFQITSLAHMGTMQPFLNFPAMTPQRLREQLEQLLTAAAVPRDRWPNMSTWTRHCVLPLDLWQSATGNDARSKVMYTIRDGLGLRSLTFSCRFSEALAEVLCDRLPGLETDFYGRPLPERPLPGPFQEVIAHELIELPLWPVPGIDPAAQAGAATTR